MPEKEPQGAKNQPTYRSGAVAKLTGIPVQTLRVWERRYSVAGPRQSATGQRQYSPEDVARLKVIKQLVDAGHAIGSVARLDLDTLRAMLERAVRAALATPDPDAGFESSTPLRAAIVGEALAMRVTRAGLDTLRVVATHPRLAGAADAFDGVTADALLVEVPTLQADSAVTVRALARRVQARRVVVEYGFGSRSEERELRAAGFELSRAPIEVDQLQALCRPAPGAIRIRPSDAFPAVGPAAPPRFDKKTLTEVAMASVALNCECPHHLSRLLMQLGDFETYSGECESRNPEDAALHRYLKETTGTARALMEEAMARVVEAEGIPIGA